MKSIKKKFKNKKGFTLAETLITVLILLLVSSIVAAGIPAAASAYTNAIDAANAQALLSTTINALRRELSTAWDVKQTEANKAISYNRSETGSFANMSLDDNGTIMIQEYYGDESEGYKITDQHPLISDPVSLKDDKDDKGYRLTVKCSAISCVDGVVTVKDVSVTRGIGGTEITRLPKDLTIRVLNTSEVSG